MYCTIKKQRHQEVRVLGVNGLRGFSEVSTAQVLCMVFMLI